MLKSNLQAAWRNIRQNKGFALLNITGLTAGLLSFMLLASYIVHEKSFDRFLPDADRVAYVSLAYKSAQDSEFVGFSTTPTAIAPLLNAEFAEVESAVRVLPYNGKGMIKLADQSIRESRMHFADEGFFGVLSYPALEGDLQAALAQPHQIVLTASLAEKYFRPGSKRVGEILQIDGEPWTVSAVIPDPPAYTELPFSAILSNKHLDRYKEPVWHSANDITLARLKEGVSVAALEEKVNEVVQNNLSSMLSGGNALRIHLTALPQVHLHSDWGSGNLTYLYVFGLLSLSILIISCVNFTNLTLAHSLETIRETGVKKVLGASRLSLFVAAFIRCGVIVILALLFALGLSVLLMPLFATYIGAEVGFGAVVNEPANLFILLIIVLGCILAGSWPVWAISALKPSHSLKGQLLGFSRERSIGNVLIVFQFIISAFFIIGTLVVSRQLNFLQHTDTKLQRSQIMVLDGSLLSDAQRSALKKNLLARSAVSGVSASYDSPVNIQGGYSIHDAEGKGAGFDLSVTAIPIEKDFVPVFEIPILAGANLSEADITSARDTTAAREYSFIVNQLLASALDWTPEEAVGKWMELNGRRGRIKAVVDNFNFASLKEEVKPVVLFPEYSYFGNIFVKISSGQPVSAAAAEVAAAWKLVQPNIPFEYHFLDEDFAALYAREQQTSKAMLLFSFLTILVAIMGLFALSAYQAQKRVKEVGIRKALGASTRGIVFLLSRDFLLMVGLAFAVASALAGWFLSRWLENFAYRISLEVWVFGLAGVIIIGTSFLTVGARALRAAKRVPVDSLRYE